MKGTSPLLLLVLVVVSPCLSWSAEFTEEPLVGAAPWFTVEDLSTLPGDDYSVANKVNNRGDVVGTSIRIDKGQRRAFLYRSGRMIDLGTLGGVGSSAFNLNDLGDVVGTTYQADGRYVSFLYHNGQMTNLDEFAGVSGVWQLTAGAINNAGQIVGDAYEPSGATLAPFYYSGGQLLLFTNHPPSIYPSGFAVDINEAGLACGASDLGMSRYTAVYISELGVMPIPLVQAIPGETEGWAINNLGHLLGGLYTNNFIYHDGELTFLGPFPEGYRAMARDINDSDDVVGDDEHTPFLLRAGVVYFLNDQIRRHSGWVLQRAYGLNNAGQIVGFGLHHGKTRAYLLTPTIQ